MELFNLGKISWEESQLIYHALAHLGKQALCLLSQSSPYVCIGFHQDVEQEVDLEFCKNNNIPVFRREVGGGSGLSGRKSAFLPAYYQTEEFKIPGVTVDDWSQAFRILAR